MQCHVKRTGTAKIEKRWLGKGCLMLAVEDKILKETLKSPAPDAVACVGDFCVILLARPSQLWIVTEQETGWHLYGLVSLMVLWKLRIED